MLKKNASADFPSVMIGTFTVTDINTLNAVVSQAIDPGCAAFDTSPSYKMREYWVILLVRKLVAESRVIVFLLPTKLMFGKCMNPEAM